MESRPESGPGILPSFAVKMTMDMAAGLELAVAILASKNIQFRYNAHPATATVDWLLPYDLDRQHLARPWGI